MNAYTAIPAKPAQFDKASQRSRRMLAMIHIAKKDLAMDSDDYVQGVFDAIGKTTCEGATEAELSKVLAWMKSKGFQPIRKSTSSIGGKRAAQRPTIRKAVALWVSLHHLGVIHNPADEALEAFAINRKLITADRLLWASESQLWRLIEALKAMAVKGGWLQQHPTPGRKIGLIELKSGLCHTILGKLKAGGAVPKEWGLFEAAEVLCGIDPKRDTLFMAEEYEAIAAALGRKLREAGLANPENTAGEASHGSR